MMYIFKKLEGFIIVIGKKKIEVSETKIKNIINDYNDNLLSKVELSDKYGISYYYIKTILNTNNIKSRPHGRKGNKYIVDEENNIAKIELKRKGKESKWTTIDLDDLERVINFPYTWHTYNKECIGDDYYAMATEHLGYKNKSGRWQSRTVYLNVFIMNPENNPDVRVDHKNHNTLDNRKCNLRVTSQKKNLRNRNSKNSNNTSGYRNVCWEKRKGKWMVQLMVNGKNTRLGYFNDVHEAGEFAKEMREKLYGEFAGKD